MIYEYRVSALRYSRIHSLLKQYDSWVNAFELIIFDCDGVLVNSERLTVRTVALILADLGWQLSESEIASRFSGRIASEVQRDIEAQIGHPVDWAELFEARYLDVFERELEPIQGILEVLNVIETMTCVASSSKRAEIQYKLTKTKLISKFEDRIFTAEDVTRGKPAPDIFLHAARAMGVNPRNCAVVEDSFFGVTAATEAKMTVFGFSGSVTSSDILTSAGAIAFGEMSELPGLLRERRPNAISGQTPPCTAG